MQNINYVITFNSPVHGHCVQTVTDNYLEARGELAIETEASPELNWELTKVEIAYVHAQFADFDDEKGTVTVSVQALINDANVETRFHVQLTDGQYRSELGCWIFGESGQDLDFSDYERIVYECIDAVVLAEEFYAKNATEE